MLRALVVLILIAGASPVAAEPTPWAHDVAPDQQDRANALFDEANQLFAQQAHAPALDKYRAAIALWDHPMIRFNMAVTEIRLDRILEAAQDLDAALRFGAAPFTADLYQQALDYQTLLRGRVGDLEVSCSQSAVQVLLDGKPWFECPGRRRLRVTTGEHVLVGDRAGFLTRSSRVLVAGGATATQHIDLISLDAAAVVEYPHARWIPWTVAGGGAAIALTGLGFYLSGKNQMAAFHNDYANLCAMGCEADLSSHQLLARERDSAILKGQVAASMLIAGGAVAAGGVVLQILNRPVRKLPRIEAGPTPGGAAATASWEF